MSTFITEIEIYNSPVNVSKLLALPFDIDVCEVEVDYCISPLLPATFYEEAEGGQIEDCEYTVLSINNQPVTPKQANIIENLLCEYFNDEMNDLIYSDYDK